MVPNRVLDHQKKSPIDSDTGNHISDALLSGMSEKKNSKKKFSKYTSVIYQKKDNFNTNKKFAYENSRKSSHKNLRSLKGTMVFELFIWYFYLNTLSLTVEGGIITVFRGQVDFGHFFGW